MRKIELNEVVEAVKNAFIDINFNVNAAVSESIKAAYNNETTDIAKNVLGQILENHEIACRCKMPMCQDTGVAVVFLEVGKDLTYDGDLYDAVNEGVRRAYQEGYLRKSIVAHPLKRVNTKDNTPAIIHTKIVQGDKLKIKVASKGGGSENMSLVTMLTPASGKEDIIKLVIDTVFNAGGKPCPPIIIGLGIGGNLEKAGLLAKEALFRDFRKPSIDPDMALMEQEIMDRVNQTNIGPGGLGGLTTCIGVNIETYPCHIASLPVAINIQCHADRHKEVII